MSAAQKIAMRDILRETQRRVPAGQRFVQEAFTSEHHHPVMVKLNELQTDTFYVFDEVTACALRDAVVDWASRHGSGRLTVSCSAYGEFQAQRHRFQHLAGKVDRIRILAMGNLGRGAAQWPKSEICNTNGGVLAAHIVALMEGTVPVLFVSRAVPGRLPDQERWLGFVTTDSEVIDEIATDIELVLRKRAKILPTFDRLQVLHETTQRVARELESYSRRMELAIERARRRPDLLTPGRFDRIVRQSIHKMEELKEIPRRALRTLGEHRR